MNKTLAALSLLILLSCTQPFMFRNMATTTTTTDGQTIAYNYYPGKDNMPGVILLHMLGRTKNDWNLFAEMLQKNGYHVIAIDLRGHGESFGNLATFKPTDFNNMVFDVAAAKEVLESHNANTHKLVIIGASIGANVALNYGAKDPDVQTVLLLSPGADYRGVKTTSAITEFTKPLFIVASSEDDYSAKSSEDLASANTNVTLVLYKNAGHGTNMFKNKELAPTLLQWVMQHV